MTLHLWYRNRELVACSHAAWLAQPPRDADGSNLSEDPAEVTCLDCLRAGHYRTRAEAAAVLALLRLGESIGLDDPRIVPVRSKLLQVGTPLDAFRLELGQETATRTAQVISLTVDVTDPAHPAHHGSFPLGLRPAQLAAGRAALRAAAQTLDHRLKEALHEPAPPERAQLAQRETTEREEAAAAWEMARAQQRHAPEAGAAHRASDLHQRHQSLGREVAVEAWEVPPPSKTAGLAAWFVRHPAAHPVWCWWLVAVCHLRRGEGLPAPVVSQEGQTHELAIIPLKPESDISPDHPGRAVFMSPDHMLPLCALTDAQAVRVCRAAVDHIVAGQSPDSDHRARWRGWADEMARAQREEVQGG